MGGAGGGMSNSSAASSGSQAGNFTGGSMTMGGFNVPALPNNTLIYAGIAAAAFVAIMVLKK